MRVNVPRARAARYAPRVHRFEEHVGEVRLALEAPTLASVLEEAARALAELMSTELRPAEGAPVRVEVTAPDRAALVAEWIDELVYRSEVDKKVYAEARVLECDDRRVVAELRGFEPPAIKTAVKAATLHELSVTEGPAGLSARVVLDV